jgi:hypothetical protein
MRRGTMAGKPSVGLAVDLACQTDLASDRSVGGNFRSLAQTQCETATAASK